MTCEVKVSRTASSAGPTTGPIDLEGAIEEAEDRLRELRRLHAMRRVELPLRFWRQQAHLTTPAADEATARKALEQGTGPMERILARFAVTSEELAEHLEVPERQVVALLDRPARAPLVVVDGEDAQALREDVAAEGIRSATRLLTDPQVRAMDDTLRFFRPPGLALDSGARDLYRLLWGLADAQPVGRFPLDGIVLPKAEHPEDIDVAFEMLDRAETALGLAHGQIKVAVLVESGWAVAQLPEIARRAVPRLSALIFGIADYAADLGLPEIDHEHPVARWAQAMIVDVAGAAGVPAIDAMTLDYPVADPSLDAAANRRRFLDRMRLVYDEATRARQLGMLGKWVGHPAQLFAVLLAFDAAFETESLEIEARKLEAYRSSVEDDGRGAMIIDGVMSDRATDRHLRVRLRQAVALGRFDPARARSLGIMRDDELAPEQEASS